MRFLLVSLACLGVLPLMSCSRPGAGTEMQGARALELGRNEEAFRLLAPLVDVGFDGQTSDSVFVDAIEPARRPHLARQHVLFARACLRTMRTMRGVRSAARGTALAPADPEAHLMKALLDQRRFRNVAAVSAAEEAVKLAPEDARYRLVLGELLLGGGIVGTADFGRSIASLREAIRLDPGNRRARYFLAKALVLSGESVEGEAVLDSLLSDGRAPADARYLRGLARMRRHDLSGASIDFRDACRIEPWRSAPWFNWAKLLEVQGRVPEATEARRRFETAQESESALRSLEVEFHSQEGDLGVALRLSTMLSRNGRPRAALSILETACADHPNDSEASSLLAEVATQCEDGSTGEAAARRAIDLDPRSSRAQVALSGALALLGRRDESIAAARRAIELEPRKLDGHVALGRRLLEAGDAAEALRAFQVARQLAPNDIGLIGDVGLALVGVEAWEEAEQALSGAIARIGPRAEWLAARGKARAALGRPGWAAEDLGAALRLEPESSESSTQLAAAFRTMNRNAEADSIEKFAAMQSKIAKQANALRVRLAKNPRDVDRAEHLARLYREAGREEDADFVLARAYEPDLEP